MKQFPLIRTRIVRLTAVLVSLALAVTPVSGMERRADVCDPVGGQSAERNAGPAGGHMYLAVEGGPVRIPDIINEASLKAADGQARNSARAEERACQRRGNAAVPRKKPAVFDRTTTYRVKPGDLLEISIWKEPDMRRETLVLPDGTISYPLAGHTRVVGMTPNEIEQLLSKRLAKYFKNPFISVIVKRTTGNQIYVLGQVHNPGAFTIVQPTDVMQALSLAGGLSEFADKGDIKVLRRLENGEQTVIPFKYSAVQRGKNLSTNVMLLSGDTVIVPERGLF